MAAVLIILAGLVLFCLLFWVVSRQMRRSSSAALAMVRQTEPVAYVCTYSVPFAGAANLILSTNASENSLKDWAIKKGKAVLSQQRNLSDFTFEKAQIGRVTGFVVRQKGNDAAPVVTLTLQDIQARFPSLVKGRALDEAITHLQNGN